MAQDLRIIFMGTPDFAVGVLKELVDSGKNIVGVITAPDKPAGRGRKVMSSAVKQYAVSQNLPVLQPTNLKSTEFLEELQALKANLQIVVAFRMLPKVVWKMPEYGTFNLHASLLPNYRGAAPINWAIMNQEHKTGVTTFFIDEKIDTGAIILNKEVTINPNETAGSLHDILMEKGGELVLETVNLLEKGKVQPMPQNHSDDLKDAPKLTPENTRIDWQKDGNKVSAFIRGLNPYPSAWTILYNEGKEQKVKIFNVSFSEIETDKQPGEIETTKKELKVAVPNGMILIEEMQLPGKRKMKISDLLNGYSFDDNSKLL